MEPKRFTMVDTFEYGRRPLLRDSPPAETGEAISACPGARLEHMGGSREQAGVDRDLFDGWGPVLGVWEGFAADPAVRFAASSGGAATALSVYCLEQEKMAGVLHTGARKDFRYLNETVLSTSRDELVERAGSRYAPASPADGLDLIEQAAGKCVFIGKPCDVAAVQKARRLRPALSEKLGLTIAFFCAGVPSTRGNLELLKRNGIQSGSEIRELRYRGRGWPGNWTVRFGGADGCEEAREMTYAESWDFLQRYRQWRCYICPDHTGEFADIAVGDPWYRDVEPGEPGKSLIVARSPRGLAVIHAAVSAGYLCLERHDASLLPKSQPNLLKTRGNIWARLIVLRIMGAAVPDFRGFSQFRYWVSALGFKEKLQAFYSTPKRVFAKKLRQRISVERWPESDRF